MEKNIITRLSEDTEIRVTVGVALNLIIIGTITYHSLENWSWVDSLYFSVIALTTVGFGDLTPSNDLSKIFTVIYVLIGVGILVSFLSIVSKHRIVRKEVRVYKRKSRKK